MGLFQSLLPGQTVQTSHTNPDDVTQAGSFPSGKSCSQTYMYGCWETKILTHSTLSDTKYLVLGVCVVCPPSCREDRGTGFMLSLNSD